MNKMFRRLALLSCVVASGGALAANPPLVGFTTQASFLAAVGTASVDTLDSLTANSELGTSTTRTTGAFSYSASAPGGLYALGSTASDVWLSVDRFGDTLSLGGFSSNVYAVGGYFFGTNTDGAVLVSQPSQSPQTLIFNVTNTLGTTYQQQVTLGSQTTFFGVASNAPVSSLSVYAFNNFFSAYPTVNNLIFAAAIPEPSTYALLVVGLGAVLAVQRRRIAGR